MGSVASEVLRSHQNKTMSSKTLKYADHGDVLTQNLASNLRQSTFADVKLICFDGSAWAHRLVLAAVSPVLKTLFLSLEAEEVVTIYLPQLLKSHVSLVLDYVYKGRMYIRPSQLQHVLGVIEVLSLECGVSVSKKVVKHEDSWTEEAVFESFYDKGFQREVCKSLKSDGVEEAAIEVNPIHVHQRRQSQRNSFNDDFKDYAVVEVTGDSDDSESEEVDEDQHQCSMCPKTFQNAEDLRICIQTHLGASAQLRSCHVCKDRNFRTALEYDLYMKACRMTHAYIHHLRRNGLSSKWPLRKSAASKKAKFLVKKSLTTLLPKEKPKNHFVPPPSPEPLKKTPDTEKADVIHQNGVVDEEEEEKKRPTENWNSCKLKIRLPSIELNRIDEEVPLAEPHFPKLTLNLSPTKGQSSQKFVIPTPKQSLYFSENQVKKKEVQKRPSKSPTKLKLNLSKMLVNNHGQKQPKARKRKASKEGQDSSPIQSSTVVKKARVETIEESLTCPTCDKIFMAKSILERHMLKSKHGLHAVDKDVMSPPPIISQALDKAMMEGRQLPHLNPVAQPKIEVGGRTVNKYECHLCKQVFLRVKDLAKHRERMMCAAYHFK